MRAQVSDFHRHTHFLNRGFTGQWRWLEAGNGHHVSCDIGIRVHWPSWGLVTCHWGPRCDGGACHGPCNDSDISTLSQLNSCLPSPLSARPRAGLGYWLGRGKLPSVSKYWGAHTGGYPHTTCRITLPFTLCPLYFYCQLRSDVRCLPPGADMHRWGFSGPVWCHGEISWWGPGLVWPVMASPAARTK